MTYKSINQMNYIRKHGKLRLDTIAFYLGVSEQEVLGYESMPIRDIPIDYKEKYALLMGVPVSMLDGLNWSVSMHEIEKYIGSNPDIATELLKAYCSPDKEKLTYGQLNQLLELMKKP